jgi:hypothetical protein
MAEEFLAENTPEVREQFAQAMVGIPVAYEAHDELKKRVPYTMG